MRLAFRIIFLVAKRATAIAALSACFFFASNSLAHALPNCSSATNYRYTSLTPPAEINAGDTINFGVTGFSSARTYEIIFDKTWDNTIRIPIAQLNNVETASITLGPPATSVGGTYDIEVRDTSPNPIVEACNLGQIKVNGSNGCNIQIEQAGFSDTQCVDASSGNITIYIDNILVGGQLANQEVTGQITGGIIKLIGGRYPMNFKEDAVNGAITPKEYEVDEGNVGQTITLKVGPTYWYGYEPVCSKSFKIVAVCSDTDRTTPSEDSVFDLCQQIPRQSEMFGKCMRCVAGLDVDGTDIPPSPDVPLGIWTAVGCIKNDPQTIVQTAIKIGLSISGGVALLMIMAASFSLSTSQGDAKKTAEAKEMITSAVIGIIFIIMSVTILEFIGVKIFKIPGFGE